MSDQVRLSAYSEAIQNLIQSERYDQAIALCQHILRYYPKHIATYRQMAVANLEKGDLHSAAELFRRVLSADPEDDVAYAGLAIIFERQALIDEAVWHLERAFELNPSHPDLRKELLRLYGERDDRPQTRLRLTPGALARLYVREGLFAQAVQEFRAILSQAPRRLDARLALAEALWHAGQMRDTTQICQEILQALPYCLKANLILAKVLQESGAEEAARYLQSAQALDPTNRVAQEIFGAQSPLRPAEVSVPQYVEGSGPAPAAEAAPPTTEQAPAQAEGFEDWFAGETGESESGAFGEAKAFGESIGFGAPSESPIEGMATTSPATPFEHWPPIEEQQAQEPPAQEDWISSWVSQMAVPSEPAESPAAETQPTDQVPPAAEEASPQTQPQPPMPQSELPPWLLSDFGLAAPSPSTPQPIIPSASSLPPWLTEFQKIHQIDSSTEPVTEEAKQETPSQSLPEWAAPLETGGTAAASPAAEAGTRASEAWPSWEPVPPQQAEQQESRSAEPTGSADQPPADQAVLAPEPKDAGRAGELAGFEIQTVPAVEEETPVELPDWLKTTRTQAAATGMDSAPLKASEEKARGQIPDWLIGLEEQIPQETASRADEERAVQEAGAPEEHPSPSAESRDELESETETALPSPQEETAAESGGITQESVSPESGAWATEAQVGPAEGEPEGESETTVLFEEAADRELYGDETAAPASKAVESFEELAGGETEAIPAAPDGPAPVEANAQEESPPSESLRRRRDPKGYSHLVQARAHCQDNRLGEALKEYDYVVQHSPRLVNTVIEDLEDLVRRLEVPLEAHRILGDAYTRADRLADALERYRFVLERVS